MAKDLHELPKLRDGLSYLYTEHCRVEQDELSIELVDKEGRTPVPCASLGVLMLGPGTTVTHAAITALAENGCSVVWVGEEGVRFYASGLGETRKALRLLHQARCVCSDDLRREVAWRMYELRFGYRLREEEGDLSLNTVRGMEGARMRDAYAGAAEQYGVRWTGRHYTRQDWFQADPINRALSSASACMYGICHAAVVSSGYSPALGFMHTGKQLSFVYDVADLYKTEITLPLAFSITAESPKDVEARVRHAARDAYREKRLLQRVVEEMDALLDLPDEPDTGVGDVESDPALPAALWEELWKNMSEP